MVKAVQPIRMNGDTLEINPDAFKLDSNAVVEDMLLRVPGLTVWGDGTITMNGRKLEKVYVDGKPFLVERLKQLHRICQRMLLKKYRFTRKRIILKCSKQMKRRIRFMP
ncbi:hypothetical protein [Niabella ginsengisoli]|uniref:Uncharacterized protein n=1 Tax=Niabella ginsengisoli TaxID=522298 RepID=A0ABS9SQ83_9BACT|nr:hypothetical protein [Niabella ginsengisoli]MCH5600512.1 hypothetical protein [Niabella ginsengisoli]